MHARHLTPKRIKKAPSTQRGFTLIELLVVVAIISLLSSVVLASTNAARTKSRDAKRIQDLKQIQIAIELYYADHGHYPAESNSLFSDQTIGANGRIGEGSGLDTLLAPYFSTIPKDPLSSASGSYYYYYDGRHACSGQPNIAVIFARNMESMFGNAGDFACTSWGGEGGGGQAEAWHIIIGDSPDG